MRYVIFSPEWGVYLGAFWGLGFWSRLDPGGQTLAPTLANDAEAAAEVATWVEPPASWRSVPVRVERPDGYASEAECVAAGLPGWTA